MNSSATKGERNTILEPTIFRDLVRTNHGTSSSTLITAERDIIDIQQSTDTGSGKSKDSHFTRPKYSSNGDVRSMSNFVDVFQKIGASKMNEKQLTFGRNASSHKKDDWYTIMRYKSPSNFTIQKKSIEREKQMFQTHLNELAPSWANEPNPKKDSVYVAQYKDKWVRAKLGDNLDTNANGKWFRMIDESGCFIVSTNK